MIRILVILSVIFSSAWAQAISCNATYEGIDAEGQPVSQQQVLQITGDDPISIRLSTDIDLTHFFVQGNKTNNSYLLMITRGPDYERGSTGAMTWDGQSSMRITRVDGTEVFKLNCQ